MSAIKKIEAQGTKVALDGIMYSESQNYHSKRFWINTMPIKQAGDKLAPADLSYILTHASVTRRLYMAMVERDPEFCKESIGGYGLASDPKEGHLPDYDLVLPIPTHVDYTTPESADRKISAIFENHFKQDSAA